MSYVPSQDQVMAQLRVVIPAVCTIITAFGVSQTAAGSYEQIAMGMISPISIIVVMVWSAVANTRRAILKRHQNPPVQAFPLRR